MNNRQSKQKYQNIYNSIENRELKGAFDGIRKIIEEQQNWSLNERLTELESNYKYMIHYMLEGNNDPQQKELYTKFIRDAYNLADDAIEFQLLQISSQYYYEKKRVMSVSNSLTVDDYLEAITKLKDSLTVINLLSEVAEKEDKANSIHIEREKVLQNLFYSVFVSNRANDDLILSYEKLMNSSMLSENDKCAFISALTMNVLQRFDKKKIAFLLDACQNESTQIAMRAIIGIIPIFQIYDKRWKYFPEIANRLKLLSDDGLFSNRLIIAIIQFIQAHETEKITKKLTEELIPEMMKLSPMIGKKINLDEWIGETGMEDKNPEWEKVIEESGLADKLQEFSELQLGGADVFHSTFSNLKTYPFFNEMNNWFLPFDIEHSLLKKMFSDKKERDVLLETLFSTKLMCNSDKYSMCFSMMVMPEEYRKMMISQLSAESSELQRMEKEELMLTGFREEETITKQYVQDLYRFFKLFSRKADFTDIFNLPLNYHQLSLFEPIVLEQNNLQRIALYYFEKNNFKEALSAYQLLQNMQPNEVEISQKIGYCHQMSGDVSEALKAYLKAELIDENNLWNLRRIAHCYRILKEPESALRYYRRLEQLKPDDMNIQLNIGHCFLELKQYEEALNYYFKVEFSDSNNTRAWRSIAWTAFLLQKFDLAQNYYQQIIENKPNAHDYLNAGHVALCLDNLKEATELYALSLKSAGSYEAFKTMLAEDREELIKSNVNIEIIPIILDKIRFDTETN